MHYLSMALVLFFSIPIQFAFAQAPAEPGQCSTLLDAAKQAGEDASKSVGSAKSKADSETQGEKSDVDACATGYITMEKNHIALDIPEFKMVDQKVTLDVPQITMKQKHIIFGTPSVECRDVQTGTYPEFVCHDTWIKVGPIKTKGVPECITTWHPIITTQCFPIMTQQDIVMGIPEIKIDQTSIVLGVPEVTMKRQDWYFDLPKFNLTEGCIGGDCKKKCDAASQVYTDHYQSILQPAVTEARLSVSKATVTSMQCQRGVAVAQRDVTLANIDANIAVVKGSLAQLQAMGASEQTATVQTTLEQLVAMRTKIAEQYDKQIGIIDKSTEDAAESAMQGQKN